MSNPLTDSLLQRAKAANSSISADFIRKEVADFLSVQSQVVKSELSGDESLKIAARKNFFRAKSVKRMAILETRETSKWPQTKYNLDQELQGLTPGKSCAEGVHVNLVPKMSLYEWSLAKKKKFNSSPFRTTQVSGPIRKAKNWMVNEYLRLVLPDHPSNYLVKGRGTEALAQEIQNFLKQGHEWFVNFDIQNYFGSVQNGPWLEDATGLKGDTIAEEVFTSPHTLMILPPHHQEHLLKAAQSGLPQGRATSSTVAGYLYGEILGQVCPADRCLYYGDDGLILASSYDEGVEIAHKLSEVLKLHPAGPFSLKHCNVVQNTQGFEMVKYWHKRALFGHLYCDIGHQSYYRLQERTFEKIVKFGDIKSANYIAKSYCDLWLASHQSANIDEETLLSAEVAQDDPIFDACKYLELDNSAQPGSSVGIDDVQEAPK